MTDNKQHPAASSEDRIALSEGQFRKGAQVISRPIADGYVPPSASMNPAASSGGGETTTASARDSSASKPD
jgi:hypothetical protein